MSKNYTRETARIGVNNSIGEKVMALALYKELYNALIRQGKENGCENRIKNRYILVMESEFKKITGWFIFSEHERVSALEFMKIYLAVLRNNSLSDNPQVRSCIIEFENNLEEYLKNNECARILDNYPGISFTARANILGKFQNYSTDMNQTMITYCGDKKVQGLNQDVLSVLLPELEVLLANSVVDGTSDFDIVQQLHPTLKAITKNYLFEKYQKGEFGVDMIENESVKRVLAEFNDIEKKIWLAGIIYEISGSDNSKEQAKEICQLLNIPKLMYLKTIFQMGIKFTKLAKKDVSDQNPVLRKNRKKNGFTIN